MAISHRVRDDNYGMWATRDIAAGAAVQDTTRSLSRMDAATIDAIDATVVVCMLNAKQDQQQLSFEEMSGIGVHLIELCRQLQRHKRAAIFLGGKARLWRFDEAWGNMVTKSILICRAHGVMAIDGYKCFKEMEQQDGGWHFAKTESNTVCMSAMIEDARNALYGAYPHGTFAQMVPLTDEDLAALG